MSFVAASWHVYFVLMIQYVTPLTFMMVVRFYFKRWLTRFLRSHSARKNKSDGFMRVRVTSYGAR